MPDSPRILLTAGLLLLTLGAPLSAAWSPLGGPVRPVITLQVDPARPALLYARVFASEGPEEDYLWRSEDAGATWRDVQAGFERPVSALAIDPENPAVIWVWTTDGQLWRSADAGDTWSRRFATPLDQLFPDVRQLLVDPRHPQTLYRVDYGAGPSGGPEVAVSRDGGRSFHEGAPVPHFSAFDSIYARGGSGELVSFDQKGLEVSRDGGQTWSLRGPYPSGFLGGRLAPSDPDVLYGLPLDGSQCLARSDDAGAHWQSLPYPPDLQSGDSCYDVAVDPRDARHVWVAVQVASPTGSRYRLFESRNGGAGWSGPSVVPAAGVVAAGRGRLYTGGVRGTGLYASQDGGHTWTPRDRGIAAGDLRAGLVAQRPPGGRGTGRRLFVLNTPIGGSVEGLYRSDDGASWVALPPRPFAIAGTGGSTLLAAEGNGVLRSQDGGETWKAVPSAPPTTELRSNLTQPQYVALLAFENKGPFGSVAFWTSDDGGAAWRRSSRGLPIACSHIASVDWCPDFSAYAVDPFNPRRRWVSYILTFFSSQPGVFLSEDAGVSWRPERTAPPFTFALAADPEVEDRLLAGTSSGLFVSLDGGGHWHPSGDLPAGAAIRQLARDERSATWYAATTDRGIYRSRDGGDHWTLLAGAPDHDNPAIAVDPRTPGALLAAFRGQGVWLWTP